ncbi:hypothetical protein DMI69_22520 [Escherichia coli]|nr:hypothetical protein [Escherichia coli]
MFYATLNENDYQIHFKWVVMISLIDRDYDYEKIDDFRMLWLCLILAHLHNLPLPYTNIAEMYDRSLFLKLVQDVIIVCVDLVFLNHVT